VAKGGTPIQIMYGVGGERDLTERELRHLAGWRDSRPVRVDNGAWIQTQLDVYGELLNSACLLREVTGRYTGLVGHLLATLADDGPLAGDSRIKASGRCAARRAISWPPRFCAG
jgi:hypothetical protein